MSSTGALDPSDALAILADNFEFDPINNSDIDLPAVPNLLAHAETVRSEVELDEADRAAVLKELLEYEAEPSPQEDDVLATSTDLLAFWGVCSSCNMRNDH
jgi:hypothetical protein